ncbi:PREDICTED: NAC domain-containing protein 41-like [Camelina sativa]|uniref:NAC domain-containing protein 41-like n=1 Tax=Camelina sativa TaxID=90675 RepID=A0ABM0UKQ6_CAMSA|nr:PREDICTED: NAC domain-containing protein 41-like [Camelina sativa]
MDISAQRFAMNGRSMRLPPGFRFDPDDEDLVFEYLAKKVLHRPMDFDLPELRSCNVDPWDLLGERNKEVYYFVKKEERERKGRETLSGYWEKCEEEEVMEAGDRECSHLEGRRKTFAFYIGKRPRGTITPWIMYEFRLLSSRATRWSSSLLPRGDLGKWGAVKVVVKEENEEEMVEDEHESDESDGEEVIQSR